MGTDQHAPGRHRGSARSRILEAAELTADDPARAAVRRHQEEVEERLATSLGEPTGPVAAQRLAEPFSFLLEGSMARVGLEGEPDRPLRARAFAADMLAAV